MNKIYLVAHVNKEIKSGETKTNAPWASVPLLYTKPFEKKDGTQGEEKFFISAKAFGRAAKTLRGLHVGDRVGVEGRLKTESYEGADGKRVYSNFIEVENVFFTESGAGGVSPATVTQNPPQEDDEIPF